MSQALYRKYRSKSLSEVVGQDHVTTILSHSLKQGKSTHAYLLTGPRGVGKTSIARILAHELNKLPYDGTNHLDIIEIDAASNNGVDDIRDLREKVSLAPIAAPKKVYIIDEVHMLSKPAFNALLKTLEEPPTHVVFILATTEVHKLPDTILSRTQRFHFRTIKKEAMTTHLRKIASEEKISITDDALELIADRAQGSFRDAISLLDQLQGIDEEEITAATITTTLGLADQQAISKLSNAIIHTQPGVVTSVLQELEELGVSSVVIADQLSHSLRSEVIKNPSVIDVIESLIEVGRSFDPSLKLFAVLLNASQPKTKPAKSVSLSVSQSKTTLTAPIILKEEKSTPHDRKNEPATTPPIPEAAPSQETSEVQTPTHAIDLKWSEVLEHIRTHHVVIFGVLQKAEATFENNTLTLHFGYTLHKKKIDDTKYRQMLTSSLVALYDTTPAITTTAGKLPPKNEQARAVAAIMGGGEEVTV